MSPVPSMVAATGLVVLNDIAKGKPAARPIVAAFVVTFGLELLAQPAPELASALGGLILLTALLTAGAELASRAGFTTPTL